VIPAHLEFHKKIANSTSLSLTSPCLCPFGFIPHHNPQISVSLCCEFRHSSHGETVGTRRPSLRKGYVRQQCVYIKRPLAKKSKPSRKPHSRTKHHVSVFYTAGVMLLYVWTCEECRLLLLTYLLTSNFSVKSAFLRLRRRKCPKTSAFTWTLNSS